jgi:hydrogenase maturation protease
MLVLGAGNRYRHDDAAGLEAARRLRDLLPPEVRVAEIEGDLASELETWRDHEAAVVIDAMCSGAGPGSVVRVEVGERPLPTSLSHSSTHAFGVAEAIELARALGTLPPRVVVYGIEGRRFEAGEGLSAEVERAVADVVRRVAQEVTRCTSWLSPKR